MMKIGIFATVLASALLLTACGGGDSDSSGSYVPSFNEVQFNHLPNCTVRTIAGLTIINAGQNDSSNKRLSALAPQECKVRLPKVNGGMTFSLKCQRYVSENEQPLVYIKGQENHMKGLENMVKTGEPYLVACIK